MPTFRRFLSRRWLLAFLGGAALLVGLAMVHPYPRQSLFGPTIRGRPWCVWEDAVRRNAHWGKDQSTFDFVFQKWLGVKPIKMKLSEREHSELAPLLVHMTHDPDLTVRDQAIHHLHRTCSSDREAVFPHIAPLAKHPDATVRTAAMFMMMNFRNRSLPILIEALEGTEEDVRWQAACQLRDSGPAAKEAIPALERRLSDQSKDVRSIVAGAIHDIDPE